MKRKREEQEESETNCLMLLTKIGESETKLGDGEFKCKTCNRIFSSFQALGGHRASHKKPNKLMVTDLWNSSSPTMKPKMHPCPICGLQFAVGQALGGHMRKHRVMNLPMLKKSKDTQRLNFCFDLNLTPLENDLKLYLRTPVLN